MKISNHQQAQARDYMDMAMKQAHMAAAQGEVPVGAVLIDGKGNIIAQAHNQMRQNHMPIFHAEMLAIQQACQSLKRERLDDCDLYVTLEPCTMCAAAISFARIKRLYFAAYDPKGGGVEHGARFFDQPTCHHAPEVIGGLMELPAQALLKAFFKKIRK